MEGLTHKMDDQKLSRPIQTWLVVVLAIMVVLLGVSLAEDNGKNLGNKNTIPDDAYTPQPPLHEINYDLMLEEAKKTCYEKMQSKPYPTDGQLYCNRTWDGWGCWDDTPAGEVAQIHCPDYLEGFNPRQYATKNCTLKGTWWIHPNTKNFWADYTTCVQGFAGVNTTQPSRTQPAVVYKEEMNKKMMMMKEAQKCHEKLLSKPYPTDGRLYCHRTWDGWGCWDDTPAGEVARTNCPNFMEGFDPRLFAYKICTPNGTWWVHPETNRTWSNYTTCVDGTGLQDAVSDDVTEAIAERPLTTSTLEDNELRHDSATSDESVSLPVEPVGSTSETKLTPAKVGKDRQLQQPKKSKKPGRTPVPVQRRGGWRKRVRLTITLTA